MHGHLNFKFWSVLQHQEDSELKLTHCPRFFFAYWVCEESCPFPLIAVNTLTIFSAKFVSNI